MMLCIYAVFVVLVLGGYFTVLVWVVGSCLAVSLFGLMYWLGLMSRRFLVMLYIVGMSVFSPPLFQEWPVESRGPGRPRYFPAVAMDHTHCCSIGPLQIVDISSGVWVPHRAAVFEVWADHTLRGIQPLRDWEMDFKCLLMKPSLLFALLTILLMCEIHC